MANTTYASLAEFKLRVGSETAVTTSDSMLQNIVNAAAQMVDKVTRTPPEGIEAFSETGTGVQRIYDDTTIGWLDIDDAISVASVVRGGTTVPSTSYKTEPYNQGSGPITRIIFGWDLTTPQTLFLGNTFYNYPYRGVGVGQMVVTGQWGYCLAANRPPLIKEATLLQAEYLYRRITVKTDSLLASLRDPFKSMDNAVLMLLAPYMRTVAP